MKSIILRELRDRKWSLLAYCLGSVLMIWLYVATFRSSQNSAQQLQELVKTYPKGLLDAIGLSNLNLDTIEIYLNAKHFSILWPILAIILALSRAGGHIAGEIQSGTMGILLSLPIERGEILLAKYLAGLVTIAVFCAVSVYSVIPLAAAYSIPSHFGTLTNTWVLTSLFMWAIYSFGLMLSTIFSEKSKVYAVSGAIIVASYALYIIALISSGAAYLRYASPFYYFDTQKVLGGSPLPLTSIAFFTAVIIVTSSVALAYFNKRDMYV